MANVATNLETGTKTDSIVESTSGAGVSCNSLIKLNNLMTIPRSDVVIASGGITATSSYIRMDTEGAAATDTLVTINGGVDGAIVILQSTSATRTITIQSGGGNLRTAASLTLSNGNDRIAFIYSANENVWTELFRADHA